MLRVRATCEVSPRRTQRKTWKSQCTISSRYYKPRLPTNQELSPRRTQRKTWKSQCSISSRCYKSLLSQERSSHRGERRTRRVRRGRHRNLSVKYQVDAINLFSRKTEALTAEVAENAEDSEIRQYQILTTFTPSERYSHFSRPSSSPMFDTMHQTRTN